MFLDSPEIMMDISFRMENKGRIHIINVSFEGGDIGHKWLACPHSKQREVAAYDTIEENRVNREAVNQVETTELAVVHTEES